MKGKPRGTTSGLLEYHANNKQRNTICMLQVIDRLRREKPNSKWSYKDVWSGAGLKSQVALDSPWNAHVKSEIDYHNRMVGSAPLSDCDNMATSDWRVLGELRSEIKVLKEQRDQALERIAQYCADTDFYKKKCRDLERAVARLKLIIRPSVL